MKSSKLTMKPTVLLNGGYIEVVFVRTLEDTSTADNGDIIRIKIFNAPSGGTADEFVLKEGDDMTGRLRMDTQDAEFAQRLQKAN